MLLPSVKNASPRRSIYLEVPYCFQLWKISPTSKCPLSHSTAAHIKKIQGVSSFIFDGGVKTICKYTYIYIHIVITIVRHPLEVTNLDEHDVMRIRPWFELFWKSEKLKNLTCCGVPICEWRLDKCILPKHDSKQTIPMPLQSKRSRSNKKLWTLCTVCWLGRSDMITGCFILIRHIGFTELPTATEISSVLCRNTTHNRSSISLLQQWRSKLMKRLIESGLRHGSRWLATRL